MQPTTPETVSGSEPALIAAGIDKSYATPHGRLPVLTGLDLVVPRGTILAILGASGAGKSTLLNVLGTLDRPDGGTLTMRGRRVDMMSPNEVADFRARSLGFIFQFHHLLPEFTAEENVMMPLLIAGVPFKDARVRAQRVLSQVGLEQRWEHRPSQLSGGEAQRVAVARALVGEPELVLADEPSGNLDPRSAQALHELMSSLAQDGHHTFVVVTHNDRLASVASRALVLESGRLRPVA